MQAKQKKLEESAKTEQAKKEQAKTFVPPRVEVAGDLDIEDMED